MQKFMIAIVLVVGLNCWISRCNAQTPNNRQNMTYEQRQQQFRLMLQRFDFNKNGRLDAAELENMRKVNSQLQRKRLGNNGNQSNKASGEPMTNARRDNTAQIIKRFDKDGDGALNDQERAAARQALQQLRQRPGNIRNLFSFNVKRNRLDSSRLMQQYDLDGDGVLNASERRTAIDALPKTAN